MGKSNFFLFLLLALSTTLLSGCKLGIGGICIAMDYGQRLRVKINVEGKLSGDDFSILAKNVDSGEFSYKYAHPDTSKNYGVNLTSESQILDFTSRVVSKNIKEEGLKTEIIFLVKTIGLTNSNPVYPHQLKYFKWDEVSINPAPGKTGKCGSPTDGEQTAEITLKTDELIEISQEDFENMLALSKTL